LRNPLLGNPLLSNPVQANPLLAPPGPVGPMGLPLPAALNPPNQ
jgi:hypothetical protein